VKFRLLMSVLLAVCLTSAGEVRAQDEDNDQIEDNLSSYTGVNAQGYLGPLRDALGSSLNSGLFMYAGVPRQGFHARLDIRGMLVSFDDDDRTFQASTEDFFGSDQDAEVPTVIGDEDAVTVEDPETGATFTFPGGFNVDRFGIAVPQLTIGSIVGTEAVARYISADTGDAELGHVKLAGIGFRHSLSSYLESLPLDLAVTAFWQKLEVGDDFIDATATTFGVQGGKSLGMLAAYAGLSYDSIDMDVAYETDISGDREQIEVDFDKESTGHLTLGATVHLGIIHLNGEFNQASNTSLAFALGLGM
jgi:hypothetical protein